MRIGGEERFVASEDAGLFRDALGAVAAIPRFTIAAVTAMNSSGSSGTPHMRYDGA